MVARSSRPAVQWVRIVAWYTSHFNIALLVHISLLFGNICQDDGDSSRTKVQKIVIIAPDCASLYADAGVIKCLHDRCALRQQASLDLTSHF